jgi:acetyl-CoA acyltransferase
MKVMRGAQGFMEKKVNGGDKAVLVDGCRIPFQRSGTGYFDLTSYDLGRIVLRALMRQLEIKPEFLDHVIMGTVVSSMATSNVAREAALGADIPFSVPAFTVTHACISANLAVTTGTDLIRTGQARAVIAGGTESLTDIPIRYKKRMRHKLIEAQKYRNIKDYLKLIRGLKFGDLLPEVPQIAEYSTGRSMGEDCDRLASRLGVKREDQDRFAARSHVLAAKALNEGLFAGEIESVRVPPDFKPITFDNGIRGDSTFEKLSRLKPAFVKPYGTVTAGNSSFLTDGASAVLIMDKECALANGFKPKAYIYAYAYTAQDPKEDLLLGPAYAIPRALDMTGLKLADIDVFEFHEAFAAQVLANLSCLESDSFAKEKLGKSQKVGEVPMEKLNILGGSLSLGHPFGATGARLLLTAANRLLRENGEFALIASCAAGAHGNAIILRRYPV